MFLLAFKHGVGAFLCDPCPYAHHVSSHSIQGWVRPVALPGGSGGLHVQ